jgi:hypothetical protein
LSGGAVFEKKASSHAIVKEETDGVAVIINACSGYREEAD